jgi:hypothetical protein
MSSSKPVRPDRRSEAFFISAMKDHSCVESIGGTPESPQLYRIRRQIGDEILVYHMEIYTVGIADYLDIVNKHPSVNCIVTASNWSGYTAAAKKAACAAKRGLFTVGEFMGALHRERFWAYTPPDDRPSPVRRGA